MQGRDIRLDFLRGVALMMIFADHVPQSLLSLCTLQSFAFADAAELFFFLSGFVAAMVYGRALDTRGFFAAAARIWRRAWDIYAAQMVLLLFVVAEVCAMASFVPGGDYFHYFRVAAFVSQTESTILQSLLLRFQPTYLDILPVYTLFFAVLPFVLVALKRKPWLVLSASFLLYLGTQMFGWNVTTHPGHEGWFFDPLAWQFVMVVGAAFGSGRMDPYKRLLFNRPVLAGAVVVAAVAATMQFTNNVHALFDVFPTLYLVSLPVEKTMLEPARLVSFFALAILTARFLPPAARMAKFAVVRGLARCGRHSLAIFSMGIILAIPGHMLWRDAGHSLMLQLIYTLAGIAIMLGSARLLEWSKDGARAIAPLPEPERAPA